MRTPALQETWADRTKRLLRAYSSLLSRSSRHGTDGSSVMNWVKLKFHWDQFPRNLIPVANVTGKSPTSYEKVGRVASLLRGSYEEAGDFQTISTCQDGLACR